MAFSNIYSCNVWRSRIEGIDNEKLAELCMAQANFRKDKNVSATGYEDSPIDGLDPEMVKLRGTIKKVK